ncbi:hypothetical protein SEUCBS139899_008396 [Sporothrix eucalyptigena]|uniref:Mitochondrial protein n=1 Tax=Sporothrix eucalyptigena TaxID=1812306 RepID=A0ABP0CJT6_9PEZI
MASLRRATVAVAALRPRSTPQLTTVRWIGGGPAGRGRGGLGAGPRRGGGGRGGRRRGRYVGMLTVAFVAGAGVYTYSYLSVEKNKEDKPEPKVVIPKAEIEFETAPVAAKGDDDIRDALSPQHRQVKNSLENPGVYAWGSNAGRVVGPDSLEVFIKEPRRISFFDGQILRDLRLDSEVGVAVTERGDVVQWGVGYWGKAAVTAAAKAKTVLSPVTTLKGKDIVKVALSNDRVIALSAGGAVYSLPISQADAVPVSKAPSQPAPSTSWWRGLLWSSSANASPAAGVRTLTPLGLGWGERVVDVRGGQEHCIMLTSKGRVFSAVSSLTSFPIKGQLGVPGLTWETRPRNKPLDAPYEVPGLKGITAAQIATGDYHSLVLAKDGALYSFGDNSTGQLCIPASPSFSSTAAPVQVPVNKLYETPGDSKAVVLAGNDINKRRVMPRVTSIAAGGATSFFTVDVLREADGRKKPSVTADTWSCGSGIYGSLGTGKWVHISTTGPGKVRALSGLSEYSEAAGAVVPIRLAHLEVGTTHTCAVLDNATHVAAPSSSSKASADTNWGADTLWWGGNEYYQLGTGKRSNQSEPVHIAPLDGAGPDSAPLPLILPGPENKSAPTNLDVMRERLSLTPRTTVKLGGNGRKVNIEQRVTCGRYVSGVYSGV